MVDKEKQTEDKILDAATLIFEEKGMDGARMQEIADKAGINKSLLHYYYRTKEKLFKRVFNKLAKRMFKKFMFNLADENLSFEDKIRLFYKEHISLLQKNPKLPLFLLNEISRNPELINYILDFSSSDSHQLNMMNNIEKELKSDRFREMDQMQLMVNVASLSVFPIVARPIIEPILNSRGVNYDDFIEQRKTCTPDFILHAITKDTTEL